MSRKDEIERLKRFFNDVKLPDDVIDMGFFRIHNIEQYLDTCFIRLEKNEGNAWFESNLKMLQKMEHYFLDQPNIIKGS
jgi:hypothetical protein